MTFSRLEQPSATWLQMPYLSPNIIHRGTVQLRMWEVLTFPSLHLVTHPPSACNQRVAVVNALDTIFWPLHDVKEKIPWGT